MSFGWINRAARIGAGLTVALGATYLSHAQSDSLSAPIVLQAMHGALVTDNGASAGITSDRAYDLNDIAALKIILEAPAEAGTPNGADGQAVNPQFQVDVTSLQTRSANDPHGLLTVNRAPDSKRDTAWDFQAARVVPEPASAVLMGIGLAAVLLFRQRNGISNKESQ